MIMVIWLTVTAIIWAVVTYRLCLALRADRGYRDVDAEREDIEVGCEFCGQQYRFDAVDAAQIFVAPAASQPPGPSGIQ